MATELVISTDRVQKFYDDLEAQKTILSSCTQLFTTLSNRFSSLQDSLSQKSQSLESKIEALESNSRETLESLSNRENSIPERESAAVARIEEQREAALSEFENPISATAELSENLRSLSRKMDSSGLLRFIVSKRKESVSLRAEISKAIAEAVDPPRLVLDAMEEFLSKKSADRRWACGMLVQALFPEANASRSGPEFASSVVERASGILGLWKGQMDEEGGALGPAEAVMLLQMVVGLGLRSRFDKEYLRKLVVEFAARRDMAKLAASLGFGEKMADIIDELVKSGKEIEAVYFASEAGLTERFSPVSLIKLYLKNSKKNASTILKNGNNSMAAIEESSTLELNSIRAIIKCVEDHKLESEFSLDSLKKRATHLEKAKAERKKNSVAASKPQNKRAYGGGGGGGGRGSGPPSYRPSKAAKYTNAYTPFNRRNPPPPAQHSPAARYSVQYNYPSQSVYEGPGTTPYASSYGVPHSQSPAAIPRQQYALPVDSVGAAGYRASGSYGGQTSYGAYDYGNAVPPTYQPSSYTQ